MIDHSGKQAGLAFRLVAVSTLPELRFQVEIINQTKNAVRVSGFGLFVAFGWIELADKESRNRWRVKKSRVLHDPAPNNIDFKRVLQVNKSETIWIGVDGSLEPDKKEQGGVFNKVMQLEYHLDSFVEVSDLEMKRIYRCPLRGKGVVKVNTH